MLYNINFSPLQNKSFNSCDVSLFFTQNPPILSLYLVLNGWDVCSRPLNSHDFVVWHTILLLISRSHDQPCFSHDLPCFSQDLPCFSHDRELLISRRPAPPPRLLNCNFTVGVAPAINVLPDYLSWKSISAGFFHQDPPARLLYIAVAYNTVGKV